MILLLATPKDESCSEVAARLRRRGERVAIWESERFPGSAEVSLRCASGEPVESIGRVTLADGSTFDLGDIRVAWMRALPKATEVERVASPRARRFLEEESTAFLEAAFRRLTCRWVPGPLDVVAGAFDKAKQLQLAARLGLEIPPTLISNSPREFLRFYREHGGRVVSKTFFMHWFSEDGGGWAFDTRPVSHRSLKGYTSIRDAPSIFQAYVPKSVELRITVVGDKVFTGAVFSQHTNRTRHDCRRDDLLNTPYQPYAIPIDVRDRCLGLMRELGLSYGGIDMIVTPDERHVFLEVNPTGEYGWIEHLTGLPITNAICDLLAPSAPRS